MSTADSTDRRVMSASAASLEAQQARTAELIGDGSAISAEDFQAMGLTERQRLFEVAPDKYRALVAAGERRFGR
jgi:hypothetical protein